MHAADSGEDSAQGCEERVHIFRIPYDRGEGYVAGQSSQHACTGCARLEWASRRRTKGV